MHANAVMCFYIVSFPLYILNEKSISIQGGEEDSRGTKEVAVPELDPFPNALTAPPSPPPAPIPQARAPRLERTRATQQPKAASLHVLGTGCIWHQQLLFSTQRVSKWLFPPLGLAHGSTTFSSHTSHTGSGM